MNKKGGVFMKKTLPCFLILTVVMFCFLLSGYKINPDSANKIEVGMTLEEVKEILGEPHRILPTGINLVQYDLSDGRHLNIQLDAPKQSDPYVIYYEIVDE